MGFLAFAVFVGVWMLEARWLGTKEVAGFQRQAVGFGAGMLAAALFLVVAKTVLHL